MTAVLAATGLYTPEQGITNAELVESYNAFVDLRNAENPDAEPLQKSSVEFIEKASGIKHRYVLDKEGVLDPRRMKPCLDTRDDDAVSIQAELGVKAVNDALANAGITADDVDIFICAASNMQRAYPAMAVEIQQACGNTGAYAYDVNVACSSATFGLDAAASAIESGRARTVVVVNPEICSAHLNWENRDCHFIFGDVATAIVLRHSDDVPADTGWKIMRRSLVTQFSNNIRNNLGFLNRTEADPRTPWDLVFKQEGRKVFKDVCPMVAQLITKQCKDEGIEPGSLKRMWLHQANINMNNLIAKSVLGRVPDAVDAPVILDEYANTSSAGSVIAFHKYSDDFAAGEQGMICSFGAGYSVGSVLVEKR